MATSSIDSIYHNDLRDFFGNMSSGCASLAAGTDTTKLQNATSFTFRIAGQTYNKATTDGIALTACAQQATATTCYYLLTIAADKTVTTTKGTNGSTTLPACPDNEAPIAVMKIVLTASATFTAGTSDFATSGVTETFAHINYYPADGSVSGLTFA